MKAQLGTLIISGFLVGCISQTPTLDSSSSAATLAPDSTPSATPTPTSPPKPSPSPSATGSLPKPSPSPSPKPSPSPSPSATSGSLSSGCGLTGKATGDFHLSTKDGAGNTRDYEVLVPANYNPSVALALTIAYHGAGGTEASSKAYGIQNGTGAANASIFVFPQGIAFQNFGVGWDDTCGGRDMPLFDNIVAYLESNYCIDKKKLYVAGFSWGCDQATALTCCRGNQIAAVSAASCSDEYSNPSNYQTYANLPCPVANQAAIRFTHDILSDGAYTATEFASTSELYRSFNACSSNTTNVSPSPCVSYLSCKNAVVECEYSGLGHATPSNWGSDTWNFFLAH